jgi:nucleoid DNA-binding protein
MTSRNVTAALVEECRTTQTKVDDFLAALHDLLLETLERGEAFRLGKIGVFRIRLHGQTPALNFYASEVTRERLKLSDVKPGPDACPACVKRANKAKRQQRWQPKRRRRK